MTKANKKAALQVAPMDIERWRAAELLDANKCFGRGAPAYHDIDALTKEMHEKGVFLPKFQSPPYADIRYAAHLVAFLGANNEFNLQGARKKLNALRGDRRRAASAAQKQLLKIVSAIDDKASERSPEDPTCEELNVQRSEISAALDAIGRVVAMSGM